MCFNENISSIHVQGLHTHLVDGSGPDPMQGAACFTSCSPAVVSSPLPLATSETLPPGGLTGTPQPDSLSSSHRTMERYGQVNKTVDIVNQRETFSLHFTNAAWITVPPSSAGLEEFWTTAVPARLSANATPWPESQPPTRFSCCWPWCLSVSSTPAAPAHTTTALS